MTNGCADGTVTTHYRRCVRKAGQSQLRGGVPPPTTPRARPFLGALLAACGVTVHRRFHFRSHALVFPAFPPLLVAIVPRLWVIHDAGCIGYT